MFQERKEDIFSTDLRQLNGSTAFPANRIKTTVLVCTVIELQELWIL
jgi:hypothetical protein